MKTDLLKEFVKVKILFEIIVFPLGLIHKVFAHSENFPQSLLFLQMAYSDTEKASENPISANLLFRS